jgi:type VI secretion system secreted protein VgrG
MAIDVGDEQVVLERIEGTEALSRPFELTADIISPLEIDLQPHLGKPARMSVLEDEELLRHFHGLVVAADYRKESSSGHHYRLTLRPWTFFLAANQDIAIFQDLSAVDIIKKVLEGAGISDVDYTRLSRPRVARGYCVQYKESDFAFISRLMEEEGIYYFFRHDEDRHVMVLCEGSGSHVPGSPARLEFNPNSVTVFTTDSKQRFSKAANYLQSWTESVSTAGQSRVVYRDFDFESPDQPLAAESAATGHHPRDDREVYHYPGRYTREKTGRGAQELTGRERGQTALDALRAGRRVFVGASQAAGLSCGTTVAVTEHPAGRMNASYLITGTYHNIAAETYRSGEREDEAPFNIRFDAIPADVNYQAPLVTPRPVVQGLESATVTGPAGETIYTDEYGRVKVRFHWDRASTPGERATCWIRVSQTGGLGNVILPRVGHEVLVDFLDGNPDRPVVVGRVFNRSNMPIYDLPANKTRATWRTLRYGAAGEYPEAMPLDTGAPSANEIRFEDKGGQEELFVHAERDMNTRVRFQETHHVGQDRAAIVGRDEKKEVRGHQKLHVVKTRDALVDQSDHLEVGTTLLIEAGTSITLKVKNSSIVIDASGITIHAPAVIVTGDQRAVVESLETKVTASATLTLDGKPTRIN